MSGNILNLTAIADELESIIGNTIPKAKTVQKYGGTLFTLKPEEKEAQFCGVFVYKAHVQLSFAKGAEINDPKKLLYGSGKLRRHINVTDMNDINLTELKKLLKHAAKL